MRSGTPPFALNDSRSRVIPPNSFSAHDHRRHLQPPFLIGSRVDKHARRVFVIRVNRGPLFPSFRLLSFVLLLLVTAPDHLAAEGRKPRTILILGDSLAAGLGVDPDQSFPALLQKKIEAAGLPDRIKNAGLSGETTAGGRRRIKWVLRQPVDLLIIELGGNDGLRGIPPKTTRENLQAIIDSAREIHPELPILLAGMRMPENYGKDYTTAFARIYPELAEKNHIGLVPFLLEGVGGRPELNQPDLIHPNPAGHQIVADNVWAVLEPLLK